ncbi:MAG: ZIP family metal transporter [Elusimicrobia bacterium CG08_land_8_20_14_0_20_51_18]|nr:MAG: ZIP family metal transporter [Elusimicrobia bacterium CG08_land_8_20_14_0_20_51_18]
MEIILEAVFASFLAGMATLIGALPVFFLNKKMSHKSYSAMLGVSGGIMLAATIFSLLLPSIEKGGVYLASLGLMTGVVFIELLARFIPHEHFFKGKEGTDVNLKRIALFALAITIHNFPEGMSVGVGWGMEEPGKSLALAIGIGIQNIPEGAAIALPLLSLGYSPGYCFFITFLSGIVEPIGGLIGISAVTVFRDFLPFALSFSAGCMLYVISGEMIPESHEKGYGKLATWYLVGGFIVMMLLDNLFG